jgi:hypothetical protein
VAAAWRIPAVLPLVAADVVTVRTAPQVSGRIEVSGYSCDVKTGRATRITAPRSRDAG